MAVDFPFPGTTGSPLHCQGIAAGLRDAGCDVTVVKYVAGSAQRVTEDEWEGIRVVRVPRRRRWRTLWALAHDGDAPVLYAHGLVSAALLAPLRVLTRRPLTVELHSVSGEPVAGSRLGRWRAGVTTMVPRAVGAHQIVLSQREADVLVRRRRASSSRVHVHYPPIPVEVYEHPPRGVRAEAPVVLYVGNAHPYQGLDLLVAAWASVQPQAQGATLRLVGASRDDLAALLATLPAEVAASVDVVGRVEPSRTAALYADADVLVIPRPPMPINDTTARKLGEYLAAGRAVVATDVGDHRLLLEGRGAGIVSAPDAASYATALLTALRGDVDTEAMARHAQQLARDEFSLEAGIAGRLRVIAPGAVS